MRVLTSQGRRQRVRFVGAGTNRLEFGRGVFLLLSWQGCAVLGETPSVMLTCNLTPAPALLKI